VRRNKNHDNTPSRREREWPRPMRMPRAENTQHEVPARLTGHAVTREVLLGNSFQEQNKGT
jgi:hypothetical protein